jgi:hypothetical protein
VVLHILLVKVRGPHHLGLGVDDPMHDLLVLSVDAFRLLLLVNIV